MLGMFEAKKYEKLLIFITVISLIGRQHALDVRMKCNIRDKMETKHTQCQGPTLIK